MHLSRASARDVPLRVAQGDRLPRRMRGRARRCCTGRGRRSGSAGRLETIVAIAAFERFLADLGTTGHYVFGAVFVGVATAGAVVPLKYREVGAQMLMYAVPILAVLFVLPPAQITSLHDLIDAMERSSRCTADPSLLTKPSH